jgi:hypothetical protein
LTVFITPLIAASSCPASAGSMAFSVALELEVDALEVVAVVLDEDDVGSLAQPAMSNADTATTAHHWRFAVI